MTTIRLLVSAITFNKVDTHSLCLWYETEDLLIWYYVFENWLLLCMKKKKTLLDVPLSSWNIGHVTVIHKTGWQTDLLRRYVCTTYLSEILYRNTKHETIFQCSCCKTLFFSISIWRLQFLNSLIMTGLLDHPHHQENML